MRVAVVYYMWPHYRQPIMSALDASQHILFDFYGSGDDYEGIKHADPGTVSRFIQAPFCRLFGNYKWQGKAVSIAASGNYDAIIYLADPYLVSTWIGAVVARIRHTPVLFWGHGWRRRQPPAKSVIRNAFFRLADQVMVYAERAKRLGVAGGIVSDKITVVYNSLDQQKARSVISRIEEGALRDVSPRDLFKSPDRPLVICTARITSQCRFDLLFEAAKSLCSVGKPINILLVGDGPERVYLEKLACELDVSVKFFGACYEEEILGQLIYHSDLTVSPGKIGLTAMHSLMYGTPAITHGNLDEQMPEVEAIEVGRTGLLFEQGSSISLAQAILDWLEIAKDREAVRVAAYEIIDSKWNPKAQSEIIESTTLQTITRRAKNRG